MLLNVDLLLGVALCQFLLLFGSKKPQKAPFDMKNLPVNHIWKKIKDNKIKDVDT